MAVPTEKIDKQSMQLPSVSKDPDAPPPYSLPQRDDSDDDDSQYSRSVSPEDIHPAYRAEYQQSRGFPNSQAPSAQYNSNPRNGLADDYYNSQQYPVPQGYQALSFNQPQPPYQSYPQAGPSFAAPQFQPYGPPAQAPFYPPVPAVQGRRVCVIPQISKLFGGENMSPFARARVPELEQGSNIPPQDLITFIDGLNEALMASPGVRATNSVGNVVGMSDFGPIRLLGAGLNAAASHSAAGASDMRIKNHMNKANAELFRPRGLYAQICKTEKMLGYIGRDGQKEAFALQQQRIMVENARAPFNGTESAAISQRMAALGDRVMQLSFQGVEVAALQDGWLNKAGAWTTRRSEKKRLDKMIEKQGKHDYKSLKRANKGKHCKDIKMNRRSTREAEKVGKMLWVVICTADAIVPGDDEWERGSPVL